jgi:hypothetical protein
MKYIQKSGAPRGYSQWCATVAGTNKADYRELLATEKQALLAALNHRARRLVRLYDAADRG